MGCRALLQGIFPTQGSHPLTEEPDGATLHGVEKSDTAERRNKNPLSGGGVGGLWRKILMKREPVIVRVQVVCGSCLLCSALRDPKPASQTSLLAKGKSFL